VELVNDDDDDDDDDDYDGSDDGDPCSLLEKLLTEKSGELCLHIGHALIYLHTFDRPYRNWPRRCESTITQGGR